MKPFQNEMLLLECLPVLFYNALNASYSHLVIAIVLTHIHSFWNNAYQTRHVSFLIPMSNVILSYLNDLMCRMLSTKHKFYNKIVAKIWNNIR